MDVERLSSWGKGWTVVLLFLVLPEERDWLSLCPLTSQGVEMALVALQSPVPLPLLLGPLQCLGQAICL